MEMEEVDRVAVEIQATQQGLQPFQIPSATFLITKSCIGFKTASLIRHLQRVIPR